MLAIAPASGYGTGRNLLAVRIPITTCPHSERSARKFSAFSQLRMSSTVAWLTLRVRHTSVVWWWTIGIVIAWVVLSIPLAILIGRAARQKDRREKLPRRRKSRTGGPPDQTAA